MSLTKIGKEQQEHGNYHVYWKDFDHNDPLSELEALYMPKKEAPKKVKSEKEKKIEELNRLSRQLYETDKKFEKAKGKRFALTIIAFSAFYFVVSFVILMMATGNMEIKEMVENIVSAGFLAVAAFMLIPIVLAILHFLVNETIFGQLSEMGRRESATLENIRKRIKALEKNLDD